MKKNVGFNVEILGAIGHLLTVTITHADLTETTPGDPQVIEMFNAEGKFAQLLDFKVDEPFSDASDATFDLTTVTVGDSDVDRYLATTELNGNGSYVALGNGLQVRHAYPSADTVDITFTPKAGDALNLLDRGQMRLRFLVSEYPPAT